MTQAIGIDSPYAWRRLAVSVAISTLGGIGMWALAVAMPAVQADLGVSRADISFPYSMNMLGFFAGGVIVGRLVDRRGIVVASVVSALALGAGFRRLLPHLLAAAVRRGAGAGRASAAPPRLRAADRRHLALVRKRRGLAVAIAASGNYIAGAIWPPIVELMIRDSAGARPISASALLRRRHDPAGLPESAAPPDHEGHAAAAWRSAPASRSAFRPTCCRCSDLAGVACCVAMSMPQVHIVAYCGDLGYGVARGARCCR